MRTKLDQIEARLQALIESSASLFALGDARQRLVHQLVSAVQENIRPDPSGRAVAPSIYTIFMHPDSLAFWQNHQNLLDQIQHNLQEAAREHGIQFAAEPRLNLSSDADLDMDSIQVVASDPREAIGHTMAFPASRSPVPPAVPNNAFLIVDGNHVFPLNEPVINIGRRPDNHLVLPDPRVSRVHAQIRAVRGQYVLFDLNSTGGTMVNGRRVRQSALKTGDVISLSGVSLIYGEDPVSDEDTEQLGYTRSMNPSNNEPPEIIE